MPEQVAALSNAIFLVDQEGVLKFCDLSSCDPNNPVWSELNGQGRGAWENAKAIVATNLGVFIVANNCLMGVDSSGTWTVLADQDGKTDIWDGTRAMVTCTDGNLYIVNNADLYQVTVGMQNPGRTTPSCKRTKVDNPGNLPWDSTMAMASTRGSIYAYLSEYNTGHQIVCLQDPMTGVEKGTIHGCIASANSFVMSTVTNSDSIFYIYEGDIFDTARLTNCQAFAKTHDWAGSVCMASIPMELPPFMANKGTLIVLQSQSEGLILLGGQCARRN